MGIFSNDEQPSWSDVYNESKKVQDLIETLVLMTNLAACRSEDLHDDLDHIYEIGKQKLEEYKVENT